jgi:hypothetical protein
VPRVYLHPGSDAFLLGHVWIEVGDEIAEKRWLAGSACVYPRQVAVPRTTAMEPDTGIRTFDPPAALDMARDGQHCQQDSVARGADSRVEFVFN